MHPFKSYRSETKSGKTLTTTPLTTTTPKEKRYLCVDHASQVTQKIKLNWQKHHGIWATCTVQVVPDTVVNDNPKVGHSDLDFWPHFNYNCVCTCYGPVVNSYCHDERVGSPNHTFSWPSLTKQLNSTLSIYFRLWLTTNLLESTEGRRMAVEIILASIFTKVWYWDGIELTAPGYAAKHITDCAMRPS